VPLLKDSEPEVRQMAAFALGLIHDPQAREPLVAALDDPAAVGKGSAAEALGLIGDASAAPAIAAMAAKVLDAGALAPLPSDEMDAVRDTPPAAFRLALSALVRLKQFDALSSVVLDAAAQPRVRWWPVAFALQRLEDPRALPALLTLLNEPHPYTRAFAAKGLGAMQSADAGAALVSLIDAPEMNVAVEAIRSLGRLKFAAASAPLIRLIRAPAADAHLRLEAVSVLGAVGGPGLNDLLIDLLGDANPSIRAAAIRSLAQVEPQGFMTILSGLDSDPSWNVRAALASTLGTLTPEAGLPRLRMMLTDAEPKVIPAVLAAIARLHPDDAGRIMLEQLKAADPVIRAAAAQALQDLKADGAAPALAEAYDRGLGDPGYVARTAALAALAAYGAERATPVLTNALGDKDWAVRVRAAELLRTIDPRSETSHRIRPVATSVNVAVYESPALINPPFSTEATIDTDRGAIRIELAMLDAPLTVANFVTLARQGFFNGLPIHRVVPDFVMQGGDPRGDGEGGPGYTIRDEINQRPYVRGAVGMALDWADTGGSQFFITHSPQPQLDARYTVFGRVISGMDVVDQIRPSDVIRRVTIWDGVSRN
jgi:cyclophilin family peptidyl-prolyl cis-trans isomerase/HEAT repeat protein